MLPPLLQPLPSWFKKQQVEKKKWSVMGETVPSLTKGMLHSVAHPMGIWVGCGCSPSQLSHSPDRLGGLQWGINPPQAAAAGSKMTCSSYHRTWEGQASPWCLQGHRAGGGIPGAGIPGWHPRSWEHLLTCSLPSVVETVNLPFQGLSPTLSSSTHSCAPLILGAAWFWSRWLCLCF